VKIESFKAIDWFLDDPIEVIEMTYDRAVLLERRSVAFSVFDDKGCVGCGGFIFWTDNEAEAWIRLSKRSLGSMRAGIRAIKESFKVTRNVYTGYTFCWVEEGWPEAQRMVSWLGFTKAKEAKELNGKVYGLWELHNGTSINGSGISSISCGANPAG